MSQAQNAPSGPADPAGLIAELATLRRRARADRHAYPLPLLVFGLLATAAAPLYRTAALPQPDLIESSDAGTPLLVGLGGNLDHSTVIGPYWLVALIGGFLFSVWWYRRHARRSGVQTATRRYLQIGAAGVVLGLLLPAALYFMNGHWDVPTGLFNVGWLTVHNGLVAPLVLGTGLLVLARLERSALLATVAGIEVLATAAGVGYFSIGRFGPDGIGSADRLIAALVPGLVLLVGGIVAVLRTRRASA